jgi:hypothetical protein
MAAISHEPTRATRWTDVLVPEMWASIAISIIWLSVLFDALFGPDLQSHTAGGDSTILPSAILIAPFAFFATWVVAKYGFRAARKE